MSDFVIARRLGGKRTETLVLQNPSIEYHCIPYEAVAFYMEASTVIGVRREGRGAKGREQSEGSSAVNASVVLKGVRKNEDSGRIARRGEVDLDHNWTLDASTMGKSVVQKLSLRAMGVDVDDCFEEEAIRPLIQRRAR